MAGTNIHSQITDSSEIHVPKGFTEAPNNTVPTKNTSGNLEWRHADSIGVKNVYDKTVDPTVSDDASQGYLPGSRWLNTVNGNYYVNVDATIGAAVWRETTNTPSEIHIPRTDNPHSVTKAQVGLGDVPNLKQNLLATTNPTVDEDSTAGYSVGSRWINLNTATEFVCVDDGAGSAMWIATTAGGPIVGVDHTTLSNLTSDDHLQYLNRSGIRPMLGDLDMDGNSIVNVLEINGVKIAEPNILTVSKDPGSAEFASIKDAMDSIVGNSASNPFAIRVGPGVFVEDTITVKPWTLIQGVDDSVTIIEVDDPSKTAIIGSYSSEIKNLTVRGSTDPGVALIYYQATSANLSAFNIVECAFGDADTIIRMEGHMSYPTFIRMEGNRFDPDVEFTRFFELTNAGAQLTQAYVASSIFQKLAAPFPTDMFYASGAVRLILESVTMSVATGSGIDAVVFNNNAHVHMVSCAFEGFENGLWGQNAGSAPKLETSSLVLRNYVQDLLIEHPGTTGNFQGVADFTKISIDTSSALNVHYVDTVNGGLATSGPFRFGKKQAWLTNIDDLIESEPAMGVIDGGHLTDGGGFTVNVASGFGYLMRDPFPDHRLLKIGWNNTSIVLGANQDRYIYFNNNNVLTSSAIRPSTASNILLGRVVTNSTGIELIDEAPLHAHHISNHFDDMLRDALGVVFDTGCVATVAATPFKIDVTSGVYFFSGNRFTPVGGTEISFKQYYRDGLGGWVSSTTSTIDGTQYDDGSGTLQPIPMGEYAKHSLYVSGTGPNQQFIVVLGQATYMALAQAEEAQLATPPTWIKDSVAPIASIIVQEGVSDIIEILDQRPRIGFRSTGITASSDHGSLQGLGDDDHQQYLLVDGSRPMSNDLDMGGNNITNVGTVDGVDVSSHGSRHLPNGADPLATAAPSASLSATTSNAEGIANSMARSDHGHAILTGNVSTQLPNQANAAGTSANLARADHIHNMPTASAVAIDLDASSIEGVAGSYARSDHNHALATAAPITSLSATTSNAAGTANSVSRSDHSHTILTGNVSTQTPDQANSAGTSANLARADHIHSIPTAAPTTVNADGNNTQGTAGSFSRSDHKHNVATGVPVATGTANTAGTSSNLARADHVHNTVVANQTVAATVETSTSSATFVQLDSMTITPAAGTYLVLFNGNYRNSNNGDIRQEFAIYVGGVQEADTVMELGTGGGMWASVALQKPITVNGSQAIAIFYRATANTVAVRTRRLTLIRLG